MGKAEGSECGSGIDARPVTDSPLTDKLEYFVTKKYDFIVENQILQMKDSSQKRLRHGKRKPRVLTLR